MNNLSELTESEWQARWRAWGEIAQNRAKFECFPNAAVTGRAMVKEHRRRNPTPVYRHPRGVSSYGSRQALHRACGDPIFAHYYDTRK